MRPSAGSMMSDVRRSAVSWLPRSYQKSLYESTPPSALPGYPALGCPFSGSNRSRLRRSFSLASNSAASDGDKTSLPLSAVGRCSGVIVGNVNVPWRSGLPSAVRAGVHLADWPDAEGTTTVAAKALTRATRQGTRIANPPQITVSMARVTVDCQRSCASHRRGRAQRWQAQLRWQLWRVAPTFCAGPSAVPGARKDVGRRPRTWCSRRSTIIGLPGKEGPMTPNIHTIIRQHVSLEVRCIDRVYLHAYLPKLQTSGGLCYFLHDHLGYPVPSPALLKPRHDRFVAAVQEFAATQRLEVVPFERGESKDERVAKDRARFTAHEGVVVIGVAQEKMRSFKAHRRQGQGRTPVFDFSRQSVAVNHYYFYVHDQDWGPAFLKIGTYLPYPVKLCLNGHEWVKQRLRRDRIRFESLDN